MLVQLRFSQVALVINSNVNNRNALSLISTNVHLKVFLLLQLGSQPLVGRS